MSERTVTINGMMYDTHTGLPVVKPVSQSEFHPIKTSSKVHPAGAIHRVAQKSQTLNRHVVRPTSVQAHSHQSPAITKFAQHPAGIHNKSKRVMSDIGPVTHPMVAKAQQKLHTAPVTVGKSAPKSSHLIKEEAIAHAIAVAPSHSANTTQSKPAKRYPRVLSIVSASFALLLLGGYFTYLNMPNLSVRVAAAQAGVNASYPAYHPDGYSINGPVAYSQGEVSMKFAANAGPQSFTITQSKSSWDSSALLDNYVTQKSNGNEVTNIVHGVTIYTYNDNAAWVNGGVLYKITGNAPLSSDQILHIATSM
jgi:hypothetical protein